MSARRKLGGYIGIVAVTLLAGLTLKTFVIDAFCVPSRSMEPTLLAGDYVFVNKLIYGARVPRLFHFLQFNRFPGLKQIERGDVIFFEFPDPSSGRAYFVKRCIALAGDTIEFRNNHIYINCTEVNVYTQSDSGWNGDEKFIIPRKGDVVSLTPVSYRRWAGLIRNEGHRIECSGSDVLVDGAVVTRYGVEKNYLFVLGDNIDHSYDSRAWGFLPEDNVEGKAMMIYLSRDISQSAIRWNRIGKFVY